VNATEGHLVEKEAPERSEVRAVGEAPGRDRSNLTCLIEKRDGHGYEGHVEIRDLHADALQCQAL
jgi:hypothetical protein